MRRLIQLFIVAIRYAVLPAFRRDKNRQPGPVRLRLALQDLGGAWVKLGQLLALRFDLLPAAYCYELFKLLNAVEPFPYAQVRQIVSEDLGADIESLFRTFEEQPFAAASIGQVHRATLADGQQVAVKVQRPRVRKIIRGDIRLMYLVASLADLLRLLGAVRMRDVIDEFARWTVEELDYQIEARNAYTLGESSAGDPLEHDPEVFFELSSGRVLTMELILGIPLIDIMYAMRDDRADYLQQLERDGYDPKVVATHITWNLLNQVYRQGYFHADLHPANLFVLPGNAIGYVDFGIVGVLSSEVRESLVHYAWNLFQGEVDRATTEFMRWIHPTDRTDLTAARTAMTRVLADYLFALQGGETEKRRGPPGSSDFEADLLNVIRSYGMTVDPSIVMYFKALITANAVIFELDPNFGLLGTENRFFQKMIVDDSRQLLDVRDAAGVVFDYRYRALRALDALDSWREQEEEAGIVLLRARRYLGLFVVAVLVGAGALFALYANHVHRLPGWTAVTVLVIVVAVGVGAILYVQGLVDRSAGRGRVLPKRKPTRPSRARRGGYGP